MKPRTRQSSIRDSSTDDERIVHCHKCRDAILDVDESLQCADCEGKEKFNLLSFRAFSSKV
jgi:hypothetical protein